MRAKELAKGPAPSAQTAARSVVCQDCGARDKGVSSYSVMRCETILCLSREQVRPRESVAPVQRVRLELDRHSLRKLLPPVLAFFTLLFLVLYIL